MEQTPTPIPTPALSPLPSASDLFIHAFSQYKTLFWHMAPVSFLIFILGLSQLFLDENNYAFVGIISLISVFASFLCSMVLMLIIMQPTHMTPVYEELFKKAWKLLVPYSWVAVLLLLVFMGAGALLIIPAIWVGVLLSTTIYVFLAEGERGMKALIKSWYYVEGRWWEVLWRMVYLTLILIGVALIMGVLLMILKVIAVGGVYAIIESVRNGTYKSSIGSSIIEQTVSAFFVTPLSLIYAYSIYDALKSFKTTPITAEKEAQIKKTLKLFIVVSIIALVIGIVSGIFALRFAPAILENTKIPTTTVPSLI